jgi:hypothetical protein
MEEAASLGPVPIPWWRFLLVGAMVVALYVGIRALAVSPQTHPAMLGPVIILGGTVGLLVGRREAATLGSPERIGHRGRRSRPAMSRSAARSYLAGLVGTGLLLARILSASAMEWMMLGTVALMVGGAGHAWVMARHHEQAGAILAD